MFDKRSNWIVWKSLAQPPKEASATKLCWLPAELRGDIYSNHKGKFAIASDLTHDLTIIDFTSMLDTLFDQGFVS